MYTYLLFVENSASNEAWNFRAVVVHSTKRGKNKRRSYARKTMLREIHFLSPVDIGRIKGGS